MTTVAPAVDSAASAEILGRYATELRGEWLLGPAAALDRLVPKLSGDKHKGQVCRLLLIAVRKVVDHSLHITSCEKRTRMRTGIGGSSACSMYNITSS